MKTILIGGGNIARTHMYAIRKLGHEITCLVGRDPQRTEAFAKSNGIPTWTTDLDEALCTDAEIVHVCTPPTKHAEIIRKCLKAEKHVICEKPLSIDPAEAAALAAEAREAYEKQGLITALCCNVRYYPANIEASSMMRGSGKKDSKLFSGSYLQEFHIPPHDDGWRFDPVLSGGQRAISEIGTHWIDLSYAWTGVRISEVFAELRNWYPFRYRKNGKLTLEPDGEEVRIDTEDVAAVLLRFENGGVGTLLLSETSPGHPNDLSIEVTDLTTSYKWDETEPEKLYHSDGGAFDYGIYSIDHRDDTFVSLFKEVYENAGKNEHDIASYAALPFPTFEDGHYIAAVCDAIKKSGSEGTWIKVHF